MIESTKIIDDFLKKVKMLILVVCDNCQLHCTYCYQSAANKIERYTMPLQDIYSLIDLAAQYDIPEISLYGGEPLYDLENCVFPIIDYIKQNYKDKITLSFVSNGLNFTRELKDKLKDIKWQILISFDGDYDFVSAHMSKAQYDQITYNLKDLSNEERNNVLLKATMDTNGLLNADKIYNKAKEFLPKNIQMNPILDAEPIEVLTSATLLKEMEILDKKRKIKNPLTLYITKQFISIGGFTYTNMDKMLVGTINKGYINFIESYINSIPNYLFQGFNARQPYNKKWCKNCIIKKEYCLPVAKGYEYSKIPCLWDNLIKGYKNEI